MKQYNYLLFLVIALLFSSCATIRVKSYDFLNQDIPQAFDSCRVAFVSDLHYKSLLKEKGLNKLVKLLKAEQPDVLLLGGDYQSACEYVAPLFDALGTIQPPLGTYAVMGNHEYNRCYKEVVEQMLENDIHLLEHQTDTLWRDREFILLSGVRNPFDLERNGVSPTLSLTSSDFVILLVHTPDYAEQVAVDNADLVLAGHTHGGQVRILGYAPVTNSRYGRRFLSGMKKTSAGVPMIITNGVGTSRRNIRIGARAEVVMITLVTAR